MKRSAAIIGPTPAFLRWTIVVRCPFRDPQARNPTGAAFRELRSLRAIAVGEIEDRIVDGICVHPAAQVSKPDQAKGFPVDEVYAAYGGAESANQACGNCVANIPVCDRGLDQAAKGAAFSKAGCFGWLPFGDDETQSGDFLRLMVCERGDRSGIVEKFQSAIESIAEPSPFPKTSPAWYGVWSVGEFSKEQLKFLDRVCSLVESTSIAWRRLALAIKWAAKDELKFVCALTPPGNSDGAHWTIESHCVACGFSKTNSACNACCDISPPRASRKMKVLGLRPYLNLVSIVGKDATTAIVESYRQRVATRQTGHDSESD